MGQLLENDPVDDRSIGGVRGDDVDSVVCKPIPIEPFAHNRLRAEQTDRLHTRGGDGIRGHIDDVNKGDRQRGFNLRGNLVHRVRRHDHERHAGGLQVGRRVREIRSGLFPPIRPYELFDVTEIDASYHDVAGVVTPDCVIPPGTPTVRGLVSGILKILLRAHNPKLTIQRGYEHPCSVSPTDRVHQIPGDNPLMPSQATPTAVV